MLTILRVIDAMQGVMRACGISTFDAVIPNEIGGMNAFEALLAAHRLDKTTLDTDLVARAYPKVWQTVRCLDNVPIVPAAVADGAGQQEVTQFLNQCTATRLNRVSGVPNRFRQPRSRGPDARRVHELRVPLWDVC
jgi:DUF917 family protein